MHIPRVDKGVRALKRYRQFVGVLIKYGFAELVDRMNLTASLKLGKRLLRRKQDSVANLAAAQRIRLGFEELGPTFIKLGQILSTRSFLLPAELVAELSKLQDDVKPMPFEALRSYVEKSLGGGVSDLFTSFDEEPIASASIAQAHRAVTASGDEVVVKIQRPTVARLMQTDLDILTDIAGLLVRYVPESKQFDPEGLVREMRQNTRQELNFLNEARNIEIFARNFEHFQDVYVPTVFWDYTTANVITTEYIDGIKISDLETLKERGCDLEKLSETGGQFILKQIFEDGFFHADPHPGNIFIKEKGVIVPVDFGLMGRLDTHLLDQVSDLLIGMLQHDPDLIIQVLVDIGSLEENRDVRNLRIDISNFIHRYYGLPLKRIDMDSVAADILAVVTRHELKTPSNLMLLMKAMATYEDVGRTLNPNFDIFTLARPYVRKVMTRRLDPSRLGYESLKTAKDLVNLIRVFPREIELLLRRLKRGQLSVELQDRGLQSFMLSIDRATNRISFSLIIMALVISSAIILRYNVGPQLWGYPVIGLVGYVIAGVMGLIVAFAILRSGRL